MTRYHNQLSPRSSAFALVASVALCAATSIMLVPAQAQAAPVSDNHIVRTAEVSTSGYDLSRPRDAERLARKIRSAARTVCGDTNGRVDLATAVAVQRCQTSALESAARKVNNLTVSALLNIKTVLMHRNV